MWCCVTFLRFLIPFVLSTEIRQKGSTNQAPAAPLQPFLVLRMTPELAERWMQKIENQQEVSANHTAAAMRLASGLGSGLEMAATNTDHCPI